MFRKSGMLIVSVLLLLCMVGCGTGEEQETVVPDVYTLSEKLMEGLTFEDSISEVSADRAMKYYGIDSGMVRDGVVYMSTGATSEELAVFQANTDVDAQNILAAMTARRDSQIKIFLDYKKSEIGRLDDAVLYSHGSFVVYVVCDDSAVAEKIIRGYLE